MASFPERLVGAAKLDALTYDEVKVDPEATRQAIVIACLAATVSTFVDGIAEKRELGDMALGLLGWPIALLELAWIWFVGVRVLPIAEPKPTFAQVFRPAAFSLAPALLFPAVLVPEVGDFLGTVLGLWLLACFIVALCVSFGYDSVWDAVGLYVMAGLVVGIPAAVVILVFYFVLSP